MTQEQTPDQPTGTGATPPADAPAADTPEVAAAPQPADRVAELEAEVTKLKAEVLYARADTENVRRRLEQQAEDRGKFAVASIAKDVLSVADNLRRALDAVPVEARAEQGPIHSLVVGVEMTERELVATFERYGIRRVVAQGQRFDPNLHQAMMEVEDPSQIEGTVVLEMQAGYTLHDRLLRPALVGVAKGGPKGGGGNVDTQA
jgi:molecular chaperone GrpE